MWCFRYRIDEKLALVSSFVIPSNPGCQTKTKKERRVFLRSFTDLVIIFFTLRNPLPEFLE